MNHRWTNSPQIDFLRLDCGHEGFGPISEQRSRDKQGIPGVVDIPVLGNLLASANKDSNTRTELIIFVKPQVIVDMVDARNVAEDLRRRLTGFERW